MRAVATREAVIGELLTSLPPGPVGRYDSATRFDVDISGQLASVLEAQLLSGRNVAAVQNDDGGWEVLQFLSAELIAPNVYELSVFLRGQAGTESEMFAGTSSGASFVLLDSAITGVNLTADELRLPLNWRYGPAGRDIGDASYVDDTHAFQGIGLRPFSPVHVQADRSGGDIDLSWVRRTRVSGDSWETVEVPLGEEREQYEVEVLNLGQPVRTLTTVEPSVSYSAAEQIEDFGAVQSSVSIRVYQVSSTWGRGVPVSVTL